MNEEQYTSIIDGLLVGTDMNDEVSRRMAYNACVAYAQDHFGGDPGINRFVAQAAERLGQTRIHFGVIKGMVPTPDDARLHLRYAEEGGPVLTGSADGLRYLSEICAALADAPLSDGPGPDEHVHLYAGEPPMFGDSYGLTLYHSANDWFDRHALPAENAEAADSVQPPPREIAPAQIAAIEFFEDEKIPLPPPLYLRYDKLYRVLGVRPYVPDEEVWAKPASSGDEGRMHVFRFRDDAQEIFEIALDLDDLGIHYFTRNDLAQVWGADGSP